jgi:hypothetical protein
MLQPIPKVPTAEESECDIDPPSDEEILRASFVGLILREVTDVALVARLEQNGENAKEEKGPNSDKDPTAGAANATAAAETAFKAAGHFLEK